MSKAAADTTRRDLMLGAVASALASSAAFATPPADVELDAFLREQMRRSGSPAMAVGLARGGVVLWSKAFGEADLTRRRATTNSMFHIASVTKPVIATGIAMLAEEGRLDLDAPVSRHLDLSVANPAHPDVAITARQLLTHTSSISDETYYAVDFRTRGAATPLGLREFLASYLAPGGSHYSARGSYSTARPGGAYDYSNVGYGLLGYIAGRAAGVDFRTYLSRRLFSRLGMRQTAWKPADVPAPRRVVPYEEEGGRLSPLEPVSFPDWSAGMLRISISSFMPFMAASANGGVFEGTRMIGADALARMLVMCKPDGLPAWLTGQGIGWMESADGGRPHINHWGGDPGVFTAAYLAPATTTGAAIFLNTSATSESKAAVKAIAARLLDFPASA